MRVAGARRSIVAGGLVLAALVAAACSGDGGDGSAVVGTNHVHALAPGSGGEVLVGTHHGLLAIDPLVDGEPELVSEHQHDFMGLAADGSGRLVASGHGALDSELATNVGLIESETGESWEEVALSGEADFHALAAAGATVYGVDSSDGRFLVSEDGGKQFTEREVPESLHWLAVDPEDPERVLGAGEAMLYVSEDRGGGWRALDRGGGLLAWPSGGRAALLEYGSGRVLRSADGAEWEPTGQAPFTDGVALAATDDETLAAVTESAELWVSGDGGASWTERASVSEILE